MKQIKAPTINKDILRKAPDILIKYRLILVWLVILGIFGSTLVRLTAISNPQADQDYLRQNQTATSGRINIDEDVRKRIEALESTPVDVEPENLGTRDPFNP